MHFCICSPAKVILRMIFYFYLLVSKLKLVLVKIVTDEEMAGRDGLNVRRAFQYDCHVLISKDSKKKKNPGLTGDHFARSNRVIESDASASFRAAAALLCEI